MSYIAVEGLEGAGKSTVLKHIIAFIESLDHKITHTREPGGTPLAEEFRALVKQEHDEAVTTETELMLMYAARSQLLHNIISPVLEQGNTVVSDRCFLSSMAYQGASLEDTKLLEALNENVVSVAPSLILYLDIDPKLGFERVDTRGERDRIEKKDLSYFQKARSIYLDYANNSKYNIAIIDASKTPEEVKEQVLSVLDKHFNH